ncbi:hypothetical protein HK104_007632 [Borealophlyctis nickersoniae]|nr:hypothetical protein HK104_007632 [Borealophlyctis nickersoniae]
MSDPPVAFLRRNNMAGVPYILCNDPDATSPVDNLTDATHIAFPDPTDPSKRKTFKLTDPSGYKEYSLSTIIEFYSNKSMEHTEYLRAFYGGEVVSLIFRRDLLQYLEGQGTSIHVKTGDAGAGESAKRQLEDDATGKAGADPKRVRLTLDEKDIEEVKKIRSRERTLISLKNVLNLRTTTTKVEISVSSL